jgi:PhoPQ-activated pathogenicity-related protein
MQSFRLLGCGLLMSAVLAPLCIAQVDLPAKTDLDTYVNTPDPAYEWKVVSTSKEGTLKLAVLEMVSQNWLTPEQVDRTEWRHWMNIAYPEQAKSDIGFLFISGGNNRGNPPTAPDRMIKTIAMATGAVVVELKMVPNQPLVFHNDGVPRTEDDLIGYTWDQYIETGESIWLARNAMVKSAVRAMDTTTAFMATKEGGEQVVDKFFVAGASKRGWTTWLTGAVDPRVVAICPIVIDVLNVEESMKHHFAAYGFWAPAVGNYVQHGVMQRLGDPRLAGLYQMVDPYMYRHRLSIPKFVLNAAGDQFFLPDSSQFYWSELSGPKGLRYVPNTDHGMDGSDAVESIVAFYSLVKSGKSIPEFSWEFEADAIKVTAVDRPDEVRLWRAVNPDARDFRLETLGAKYRSELLKESEPGVYLAPIVEPEKGWSASFVELTYDIGAAFPLKLTTAVKVVPDVLPYADRDPSLPPSLTVRLEAKNESQAEKLISAMTETLVQVGVTKEDLQVEHLDGKVYFNFDPNIKEFRKVLGAVGELVKKEGGNGLRFQLESGRQITLDQAPMLEAAIGK